MDTEQLAIKLQETTDRSVRNEGRIKKLESEHSALHELAKSVAVMAEKMNTINTNVKTLADKVDELEEKPAKRWESVVDKGITLVVAAIVGFILAKLGL